MHRRGHQLDHRGQIGDARPGEVQGQHDPLVTVAHQYDHRPLAG